MTGVTAMRGRGRTVRGVELSLRARLRAGDPSAFGEIFDDHAGSVYRYAVRATGDRADAEDVVSLTFLEAWRLRRRLRPDGDDLRPWLLAIATNVLRNVRRAARRHHRALTRLPARDVVPDFADEVVGRLADGEQLAAARAAMERLRPADREVVALCVCSGLEHTVAAEVLGVTVGTLRSRLSRARARLRDLTEKELRRRPGGGQLRGDRASAVRSIQETNR